jgi:hypothetical protein
MQDSWGTPGIPAEPWVSEGDMALIEGEITIDRSADEVFDFVADESNEPRYNLRMTHVEKTSPGPIGRGTRFQAATRAGGRTNDMTIEFTEFDRPTRLASWTRLSTMDIRGTLTFQPINGSTRMKWAWLIEPHGLMRLVPPPMIAAIGRRQEQAIWSNLKQMLEQSVV